jgi:mannosyltransferase OCH1-like enzyme
MTNKRDKNGNPLLKTTTILDYVKNMGDVDMADQLMQYYNFSRRTVKWWVKLFFHFFNLVVTNAFILYKKAKNLNESQSQRAHLKFREVLAKSS